MRYLRRGAAALLTSFMLAAMVATPASADTPERFTATSAAQALAIKLLDQEITFGKATGAVSTVTDPLAEAAGQVLPTVVGATKATTTGLNTTKKDGQTCGLPQVPDPLASVLSLSVACSTSIASITGDGLQSTSSTGHVAELGVKLSSLLSALPLPADLDDLPLEELDEVVGQVTDALNPLLEELEDAGVPLDVDVDSVVDLIDGLIQGLLNAPALSIQLGAATSTIDTLATSLTAGGKAEAAVIKLLPISTALGNIPLATITAASSQSTASYDRNTGSASATPGASLVKIQFAPILGLPTIDLAPGQDITILEGTPLQSTIKVAAGAVTDLANGGKRASADGVLLHLLQGVGAETPTSFDGGVLLNLAHSEAEVVGAPAVKTPVTNNPTVAGVQQLPRTGGTPWIPIAGIGVLGLAVFSRRLAVRTR